MLNSDRFAGPPSIALCVGRSATLTSRAGTVQINQLARLHSDDLIGWSQLASDETVFANTPFGQAYVFTVQSNMPERAHLASFGVPALGLFGLMLRHCRRTLYFLRHGLFSPIAACLSVGSSGLC